MSRRLLWQGKREKSSVLWSDPANRFTSAVEGGSKSEGIPQVRHTCSDCSNSKQKMSCSQEYNPGEGTETKAAVPHHTSMGCIPEAGGQNPTPGEKEL